MNLIKKLTDYFKRKSQEPACKRCKYIFKIDGKYRCKQISSVIAEVVQLDDYCHDFERKQEL